MSDTRSPAVRAIDELIAEFSQYPDIERQYFRPCKLSALKREAEVGALNIARAAVIAAEREAGKSA